MSDNDGQVEVKTPGGWSGKFTGSQSIFFLLVVLLGFGAVSQFQWKLEYDRDERRSLEHGAMLEAQTEMTYVLTLDQAGRERLKLAMPESLRKRIMRDDRRERP